MLFPAIAQAAESIIAEPSQMSYIPFTLWVLVTGISLVIVIVILCTYLFYQKFLKAFGDNALSFADLAAQKEQVEAEIEQCRMWLQDNREELLKQDAQRREQELLLLDLKRLQMESAQTEQRRDDLRKEASDLQNVVSTLVQDRDRLLAEKGTLEGEKADAEVATRGAEEARQLADTAAQHAEQGLRTLEVRYTDEKKRVDILVQEIADKEVRHHTLTHAITALTETRAAWQDELLTLEVERREQEDLRKRLEELRRELVQQEDAMHSVRKEASELQGAVTTLREARARLEAEKVDLDKAKAAAETAANDADEARQRAVNAAKQSAEELQSLKERSQEEQQNRNGMLRDICDKEIKLQSLMQENTALDKERTALEAAAREAELPRQKAIEAAQQAHEEWQGLRERCKEAQQRREEMLRDIADTEIKMQRLMHEIAALTERLADLHAKPAAHTDDRYVDLLATCPACLGEDVFPGGNMGQRNEDEALFELQQRLRAQGLLFSERTLKAFHTSLKVSKINPLTVLAGVSGTGKSRLPIEYAKAMGMHSLVVAVQPRWDSPQDLFGFYNYLEHKYKATDLARALVRMDKHNFHPSQFPHLTQQKRDDRMLLVLLDEMNLARIEYYFSEFLSKLEVRQAVSNSDDPAQRAAAEIEFEIGPREATTPSFRLWVGGNVLFVGTMNEDESTQTLSDKVLDRANVLRFGRPPEESPTARGPGGGGAAQHGTFLTLFEWHKWLRHPSTAGNPWDHDVKKWITSVNAALDHIGRPFGYRVQQGIHAYILNYPSIEGGSTYKTAFADQVEQKVLPKLRGIDMRENVEALDTIERVLEVVGDRELLEAFQRSKDDSSGMFVWRGVTRPI